MNQKREDKNMRRLGEISAQLPQIEKELDFESCPKGYDEVCKYLITLFTNGMRISKHRQELCRMRKTGDFPDDMIVKAISSIDRTLDIVIERYRLCYEALKEYETR